MNKNFNALRFSILSFALLMLPMLATAQQLPGDLQFGIQASPTFGSMNTDNNLINRDGSNLGLKLGLVAEYYFRENYSFHTGLGFHFNAGGTLFYEDRFTKVDIWRESLDNTLPANALPDSISGGLAYKYELQFLEIPVGLTLRTREFGYLRYFLRPAFHIGVVTRARGSIKNASFISSEETFDIGPEVNGVNLSWSLGGGVEYSISTSTALVAGLAYQAGFADMTRDNGTSLRRDGRNAEEDDSKGKVGSLVLMIGIMF
ncbi:MAG: porin family protein [Bacteroidota bacterium]